MANLAKAANGCGVAIFPRERTANGSFRAKNARRRAREQSRL